MITVKEVFFKENLPTYDEVYEVLTLHTGLNIEKFGQKEFEETLIFLKKKYPNTPFDQGVYEPDINVKKFTVARFHISIDEKIIRVYSPSIVEHYLQMALIYVLINMGGNYEEAIPEWAGLSWEKAKKCKGVRK